jgi:hypothetical protein
MCENFKIVAFWVTRLHDIEVAINVSDECGSSTFRANVEEHVFSKRW